MKTKISIGKIVDEIGHFRCLQICFANNIRWSITFKARIAKQDRLSLRPPYKLITHCHSTSNRDAIGAFRRCYKIRFFLIIKEQANPSYGSMSENTSKDGTANNHPLSQAEFDVYNRLAELMDNFVRFIFPLVMLYSFSCYFGLYSEVAWTLPCHDRFEFRFDVCGHG